MTTTWVADACRLWAEHIGLIPHGRMGKALKPLVDLFGYEQVGVWLRTYVQLAPITRRDGTLASPEDHDALFMANARWMSPERFVETFQVWKHMSGPGGGDGQ